ncbi:MAG: hypothetical protein J2P38_04515 [Candidatus Dormibacteraeota bacterium]|nr:hypothetical protein [Candidatus Dormibacteraeota bacterium]
MDWTVVADLGTAVGTLVLAIATFLSIRTANRSNRTADRALQQGFRPILLPSLFTDPVQKIHYVDEHWQAVPGGRAILEVTPTAAYLGLSVRDIGTGPAVIDAWDILDSSRQERRPFDAYHRLTRDLYVAAGACGYVQVAARDPAAPAYQALARAERDHRPFAVDVLYSDIDEIQHRLIRIALNPTPGDDEDGRVWALNEVRHWTVTGPLPERHA